MMHNEYFSFVSDLEKVGGGLGGFEDKFQFSRWSAVCCSQEWIKFWRVRIIPYWTSQPPSSLSATVQVCYVKSWTTVAMYSEICFLLTLSADGHSVRIYGRRCGTCPKHLTSHKTSISDSVISLELYCEVCELNYCKYMYKYFCAEFHLATCLQEMAVSVIILLYICMYIYI